MLRTGTELYKLLIRGLIVAGTESNSKESYHLKPVYDTDPAHVYISENSPIGGIIYIHKFNQVSKHLQGEEKQTQGSVLWHSRACLGKGCKEDYIGFMPPFCLSVPNPSFGIGWCVVCP